MTIRCNFVIKQPLQKISALIESISKWSTVQLKKNWIEKMSKNWPSMCFGVGGSIEIFSWLLLIRLQVIKQAQTLNKHKHVRNKTSTVTYATTTSNLIMWYSFWGALGNYLFWTVSISIQFLLFDTDFNLKITKFWSKNRKGENNS